MNVTSKPSYDRAVEDLGNIVNIGHVNFRIPDQGVATAFYMTGLGLTRDPFMMTGTNNMWVNVGDSQFHLPTGPATVAEGVVTGLVVPDLDELAVRLEFVSKELAGTNFTYGRTDAGVEVTCPWGNRFVCHAPDESRFGPYRSWISYVRFEVARGAAEPIARFYREVMSAVAKVQPGHFVTCCWSLAAITPVCCTHLKTGTHREPRHETPVAVAATGSGPARTVPAADGDGAAGARQLVAGAQPA